MKIEDLKFVLTKIFFRKKSEKFIPVRPKNYRRIVLYAIENCKEPKVFIDGYIVDDFSEKGPIVQKRIGVSTDFLIRDGEKDVLRFHDHPDEMGISEEYKHIAEYCQDQGWLKVEYQKSV